LRVYDEDKGEKVDRRLGAEAAKGLTGATAETAEER
jgi:hypothetical protein